MTYRCDFCPSKIFDFGTPQESLARARFLRWRIFEGNSITGQHIDVKICPKCAKSSMPPRKRSELEGQLDLFDSGEGD